MQDHKIDDLLSSYSDNLGHFGGSVPRRNPIRLWKPVFATGTIVVAVGTFLLLPKNAEAAKIMKVKNAIKHALSSELAMSARFNGGPWREFSRQFSQGEKQRIDAALGQPGKFTTIYDARKRWLSYEALPFSTIEPTDPADTKWLEGFTEDPLAFAMSILDGNSDPNAYTLKTSSKPDGTYLVDYSRNDGDPKRGTTTLQIVVDQASNLPLQSLQTMRFEWGSEDIRTTYKYGIKVDPQLFEIDRSKKLYDLKSERESLASEWSKVITDGYHAPIYSSSMTPDGTVWIAFGADGKIDSEIPLVQAPCQLVNGSTKYILATEFLTTYTNIAKDFTVHNGPVLIAAFVPVKEVAPESGTFQIRFGTRKPMENIEESSEAPSQHLKVSKESMALPEYMIGLGWQKEFLRIGITLWRKKAEAREALGDIKGAIQAYEGEIKAYENFVIYASYRPMLKAADCYEKLGNLAKAKELRTKAAELQKSRIR